MYSSVGNIISIAALKLYPTSLLQEEKLAVSEGSTPIVLRMSGRSRKELIFLKRKNPVMFNGSPGCSRKETYFVTE